MKPDLEPTVECPMCEYLTYLATSLLFHVWSTHIMRDTAAFGFSEEQQKLVIIDNNYYSSRLFWEYGRVVCPWCGEIGLQECAKWHLEECLPYQASRLAGTHICDNEKIISVIEQRARLSRDPEG